MPVKRVKRIKPNVKFIHRLQDRLRANPDAYDQQAFGNGNDNDDNDVPNVCGTPMCIAGHAFLMTGKTLAELHDARNSDVMEVACNAMGFTMNQVDVLFGGGHYWPQPFYLGATDSKKKKVEKACKYLDAMIEGVTLVAKKPYLFKLWG
jgi:hypothetical protein